MEESRCRISSESAPRGEDGFRSEAGLYSSGGGAAGGGHYSGLGFTGLPAVTIVSAKWPGSAARAESISVGDLFSFAVESQTYTDPQQSLVFLSPIADMILPPVALFPQQRRSGGELTMRLEPLEVAQHHELWFALVPAVSSADGLLLTTLERLSHASYLTERLMSSLQVFASLGNAEYRLTPAWGPGAWQPRVEFESLWTALSYARGLLAPFIFRITPTCWQTLLASGLSGPTPRSINLKFLISDDTLQDLVRESALQNSERLDFTVLANVVPMMNLDVKAWEPDLSLKEFARTSAMEPLGLAGLTTFKRKSDVCSGEDSFEGHRPSSGPVHVQVAGLIGESSDLAIRRLYPESASETADVQTLAWMTLGSRVNGLKVRHTNTPVIQPKQRTSNWFRSVVSSLPMFGGRSVNGRKFDLSGEGWKSAGFFASTGSFTPEGLRDMLEDIAVHLSDSAVRVLGPSYEIRLVKGLRQRVTVFYLKPAGGESIDPWLQNCVQSCVEQRIPLGMEVYVDVAPQDA